LPASNQRGWWEDWPWRLVQTNLREVDMRDIDAERYVASLRDLHATIAMINTSGIIASYLTALPFHTPSAFLQGDGLAEIIGACHTAGIKVVARNDFSKVRRALFDRHPEWAYRRSDGAIVEDEGDVHVCPSGVYQQECAPRIVEERARRVPRDRRPGRVSIAWTRRIWSSSTARTSMQRIDPRPSFVYG
jgi:hypothetical protein